VGLRHDLCSYRPQTTACYVRSFRAGVVGIIGKIGALRSIAWIRLFSTASASALSPLPCHDLMSRSRNRTNLSMSDRLCSRHQPIQARTSRKQPTRLVQSLYALFV
jgi:hypothetical protein